jgi:excisionase family DNA binding protein
MTDDRVPLYVRLPRPQVEALDALVASTGRRKQQLVSDLLSDRLVVGRAEVSPPAAQPDVLTLEEAAALLRVSPDALRRRAAEGTVPARRFGEEWRFVRTALLSWLTEPESPSK